MRAKIARISNRQGKRWHTRPNPIEQLERRQLLSAVSISQAAVNESTGNTVTATLTVTLNQPDTLPVAVNYTTRDSSAVAFEDYIPTSGTLIFNPGETSKTFSVLIIGDAIPEASELIDIQLFNVVNSQFVGQPGRVVIADDDASYTYVSDVGVTEGNVADGFSVSVPVRRYGSLAGTSTVAFRTVDNNAVALSDYQPVATTLTFAPGESLKTVSVPIIGDNIYEVAEAFMVQLDTPRNTTVNSGGAFVFIADDDFSSFYISSTVVQEGDSGTTPATLTVTRVGNTAASSRIDYTTNDISARAIEDYVPQAGTLIFGPGETSKTITVNVVGDNVQEGLHRFEVDLLLTGNGQIEDAAGQVDIIDNDESFIVVSDSAALEGNGEPRDMTFVVTRTGHITSAASVEYATSDSNAVAGVDYATTAGTLNFAPGETTKTIVVPLIGDATPENPKVFVLNIGAPINATIVQSSVGGFIVDDDTPGALPTIVADDLIVQEGTGQARTVTFNIRRFGDLSVASSAEYVSSPGSAASPADFTAVSGTLAFAPGEAAKTITVSIAGDTLLEGTESFAINLQNLQGAVTTGAFAVGYIVDDDASYVSFNDFIVPEGDSGTTTGTFTITRTGSIAGAASVTYRASDFTAAVGSDYLAAGGTVNFAPGEVSKAVSVTVRGDTTLEGTELLSASVDSVTNATLINRPAYGFIVNDDFSSFFVDDAEVLEGDSGTTSATLNITRLGELNGTATVTYATADNSATAAGVDYTVTSGSITFAPGEATKTLTVQVNGDQAFENVEAISVNVGSVTNSVQLGNNGRIIIADDDLSQIVMDDVVVVESAPRATVTVHRIGSTAGAATFNYATGDGNAKAGEDYEQVSNAVEFAPGETTRTIEIPLIQSGTREDTESFTVNASTADNTSVITGSRITILDDTQTQPLVARVFVEGSTWAQPFLSALQTEGAGSAAFGYAVPDQDAQLKTLPWTNVDKVSLRFNKAVNVKQSDLTVRGVRVPNYDVTGFIYDLDSNTATWTLGKPINGDRVLLELNGGAGGVTAGDDGRRLDGDYSGVFPSGNGAEGGNFRFRLNVLPADASRNGEVNAADLGQVRRHINASYSPFYDVNADGTVDGQDEGLVLGRQLQRLPLRATSFRPVSLRTLTVQEEISQLLDEMQRPAPARRA